MIFSIRTRCYKQVAAYRWGPYDPKKAEVDAEAKKKERSALPDHSKKNKSCKKLSHEQPTHGATKQTLLTE